MFVFTDRFGPTGFLKYLGVRHLHYTRVDQRPTAKTAGDHGYGVLAPSNVIKAIVDTALAWRIGSGKAHVSSQVGLSRWERAGKVLPATLKHAYTQLCAAVVNATAQFGRGNSAAVSASDDHDIEIIVVFCGNSRTAPRSLIDQRFKTAG